MRPLAWFTQCCRVLTQYGTGLQVDGETVIDTAESVYVTFPGFFDLVRQCNGDIKKLD